MKTMCLVIRAMKKDAFDHNHNNKFSSNDDIRQKSDVEKAGKVKNCCVPVRSPYKSSELWAKEKTPSLLIQCETALISTRRAIFI